MGPTMRFVQEDEIEKLQRFLERCYGHCRDYFLRYHPVLQEIAPDCSLILDQDGDILSHVGVYPLNLEVGPAQVMCGGIGGVASAMEHRGQGYMAQLMQASIRHMREMGWPLSVLWGDRQRYGHLGYETCGVKYILRITRRSLERAGIKPSTTVREVDKSSPVIIERLRQLSAAVEFGVERPKLGLLLSRPTIRVFMGDEGYLISTREHAGDLNVSEVVSPSGREAELILGALEWALGGGADVEMAGASTERMARLFSVCNYWRMQPQGMFRIINWPQLLEASIPYLTEQAVGLPSFGISVGCRWQDSVDQATVEWDGKQLAVSSGKHVKDYVELDNPRLTSLFLGGPSFGGRELGLFGKLLPMFVHIPGIDHV